MGQAGGQLAERGQVFGARHLGAMQALDFFAAFAQLLHHVVEVAAEVSDLVVTLGKADGDVQIAFADQRDLLLQFDHGPLNHIGQRSDRDGTDGDGSRSGNDQHGVAFRVAKGYGRHNEEQQSYQQHEYYWQERLELPIDADRIQFVDPGG